MRTSNYSAAAMFGSMALLAAFATLQSQTSQPIGVVERTSGQWKRAQGGPVLRATDFLFAGDTILLDRARAGAATSASLAVLMLATNQLWEKTCTNHAPCEGSIRPPQPAGPLGFWAFLTSFWSSPEQKLPPSVVAGRGVGDERPTHALLERVDGSVDLGPALVRLSPGAYVLTLAPAPGAVRHDDLPNRVLPAQVRPNAGPVIADAGIGLYVLSAATAAGEPVGSSAVILIVERGSGAQSAWQRAKAESGSWSGVSPTTVDSLMARALYALDAQNSAR